MKKKDIKQLQIVDLEKKHAEVQQEIIKLRASAATGTTPKNPGQIRALKRTIAQLNTELKQREVMTKQNG